jgi:hypothetical protein
LFVWPIIPVDTTVRLNTFLLAQDASDSSLISCV